METEIKKNYLLLNISRYASVFVAIATIIFGISEIVGWHADIVSLVRFVHDTKDIVYNTAFLFILFGFSIIAILYNYIYISVSLVFIILVFSIATILQYIFNMDLGVDQLLFKYDPAFVDAYPGRMGYETTINFIMASFALLLTVFPKYQKFCLVLSGSLGMLILGFGLLFISGYLAQVRVIYQLENYITLMTFNAAVGFVLLSSSIIALSLHQAIRYQADIAKILPFALPVSMFTITSFLAGKVLNEQIVSSSVSYTPSIIFIIGSMLTIFLGLSIRFSQIANASTKTAKHFLSLANATLESTADGILVTDLKGKIISYNEVFLKMWQISPAMMKEYTRNQLIDIMAQQLISKIQFMQNISEITKNSNQESAIELKLRTGFIFEQYSKPQYLDNDIIGQVWSYHDITAAKQLEGQLLRLATRDVLTELPNRALLLDLMQQSFELAKKDNRLVAVILIDLDRFTQVNDTLGHAQGDRLLQLVARRLRDNLPVDTAVGRIGGDKFLVFSNHISIPEGITPIIQKITRAFEKQFDFKNFLLKVTCCIGVSFYPRDGQDVDILLSNAEIALIRAKKEGHGSFQFYTPGMNAYTLSCMALEDDLYEAVKQKQFILHYQPFFKIGKQKIVGVEALIRWQHPIRGQLAPNEFIAFAEEIGLIDEIGVWVLATACHQAKEWGDQGYDLKMAVNVSAHQFKHHLFIETVKAVLAQTKLKPENLELELTERILLDASKEAVDHLNELRNMGVSIALDDFGTGYSSLSYLKQFFVDKLKIDYGFIKGLVKSKEDKAIVETIIAIGKNLNMQVIAEGIETEKQLELLIKLGCGYGQGFYLARPMPFDECTAFLKQHYAQKNPSKTKAKQVAPLL